MSRLGSMVVRMVLDGLGNYKADLDKAAQVTTDGATKIEQASTRAGDGITRMGGAMGGAAGTAVELAGAAGLAGTAAATLAAGVGLAAYAAFQGSKEQKAYNQALILTGNISGTTAMQMQGMAAGIDAVVGTHYQAAAALTAMASTGQVAGSNLQAFAQVAIQTERVVGTSVADTAKVFAQLGEEPVKASIKLNESMNYLTASTFEQIKAAKDLGDNQAAASIAQTAYANAQDLANSKIAANMGMVEKAWYGAGHAAQWAWDRFLDVGRPQTVDDKLTAVNKKIEAFQAERQIAYYEQRLKESAGGVATPAIQAKLDAVREVLKGYNEQATALAKQSLLSERVAQQDADRAVTQREGIAAIELVDKANERALTKQQQMTKELDAYHDGLKKIKAANPDSERLDPKTIAQTEAAITARYAERVKATREVTDENAKLIASVQVGMAASQAEIDLGRQLTPVEREIATLYEKIATSKTQYTVETLLTVDALMQEKLANEAAEIQKKKAEKADLAASEAHWKYIESLDKGVKSLQAEVDKQLEHNARLGLSKIAVAELDAAKLELTATEQERQAIRALDKNLDEGEYAMLMKLAKGNRDLAEAKRGGARRETELDAEKEINAERKRGWEETDRLGREAFVNQEISAKKVGETLWKGIKSALYQASIQPLLLKVYTTFSGGGGGAAGSAADSVAGSSGSSVLGSMGSSFGVFGAGFKAGIGAVFGEAGTMGGLSAGTTAIGAGNIAGGVGTLVGTAMPWIAGAMALKSLTDYKIDAKGSGITATIGGANGLPSGQVGAFSEFQQTGGLGGGGVTTNRDWSVADQSVADYIGKNVQAITASNKAYADAIGLTSTTIDGFTKNIEVNLTGLDAAGQKAAIDAELTKFAAEQASAGYGDALNAVARDGETTSVTLGRLATDLGGVNSSFAALGYTLYDVSVAGAAAASGMTAAFGSLQNFQAQTQALFQNYYTAEEQKANAVSNAAAGLNAAGITGFTTDDISGASREQIRAVVDQYAAKKGTTEGDKQYAAVVTAANYLNQYVPGFVEAVKPVVAAGGSGGGSGGGGSGGAAMDSAMDEWKRGVDAIVQTMADLRTTMIANGPDKLERLQGQLAIEIAQAKAGSLTALQDLPQLAKLTSSAYAERNRSSVDQAVFNARLVESLGGVVGSEGGANYVPRAALAGSPVAVGSMDQPTYSTASGGQGGGTTVLSDAELAQAMRDLARLMALVATNTGAAAGDAKKTADMLTAVTRGRPYLATKEHVAP